MQHAPRVLQLPPPYKAARRLGPGTPGLGSILLIDATQSTLRTEELRRVAAAAPWCPLCVLAQDRWSVRHIKRTARVSVVCAQDHPRADLDTIIGALTARPAITASDFATWIVNRTRMPLLRRTLTGIFAADDTAPATDWARREQLDLLGSWGAAEWRDLFEAVEALSRRAQAYVSPSLRRTLALESETTRWPGWEWLPEAALHSAGFFAPERVAARQSLGTLSVLDASARRKLIAAQPRRSPSRLTQTA